VSRCGIRLINIQIIKVRCKYIPFIATVDPQTTLPNFVPTSAAYVKKATTTRYCRFDDWPEGCCKEQFKEEKAFETAC
jgi:hypothetical protein